MLQYLVILLDDTSVSYCHYENKFTKSNLIPLSYLREGILFGLKENLVISFVYPESEIPNEYKELIKSVDNSKIAPSNGFLLESDVIVFNDIELLIAQPIDYFASIVLRIYKSQLFNNVTSINNIIGKYGRLNIVIIDVDTFTEDDYIKYKKALLVWSKTLLNNYVAGDRSQFNLLTDRLVLDSMNNCGAGWNSITLAPDGNFYVCPAFYCAKETKGYSLGDCKSSIGNIKTGLKIKNPQLYKLQSSPICRECDAYQCKRCIWLNRKNTNEINTPSQQQCITSHLERNESQNLLQNINNIISGFSANRIPDIDYLDPFEKIIKKQF